MVAATHGVNVGHNLPYHLTIRSGVVLRGAGLFLLITPHNNTILIGDHEKN